MFLRSLFEAFSPFSTTQSTPQSAALTAPLSGELPTHARFRAEGRAPLSKSSPVRGAPATRVRG